MWVHISQYNKPKDVTNCRLQFIFYVNQYGSPTINWTKDGPISTAMTLVVKSTSQNKIETSRILVFKSVYHNESQS
mgnify:CR=1 FL=1